MELQAKKNDQGQDKVIKEAMRKIDENLNLRLDFTEELFLKAIL